MKSKKLEAFSKNKKQRNIIISSIVGVILLIGGISLYRTFALYEEKKEFNVLKGKVADFRNTFNQYIINQSKTDDNIEKFDHEATEQTTALTDYRYTGANPNNYVYFGCEGETCTEDNLYRIIGVIPTQSEIGGDYENRVKLIKTNNWIGNTAEVSSYTKEGKGYRWNTNKSNAWESSSLKGILNDEYYNSLGEYQKYISSSVWYLGAPSNNNMNIYTPKQFYIQERSNIQGYSKGTLNTIDNIGLMYPSDYGFSIGNKYQIENVYNNREIYINNSWLYQLENNFQEWTITPEEVYTNVNGVTVWYIISPGYIYSGSSVSYVDNIFGVRPTFYLKSDVLYESGNGSQEKPYRISIE